VCIFAPLKTRNRLGLLAQLVQSIWFTPRGSGVRIPQGPQRFTETFQKNSGLLAQLVQSIWFTPRGSGVRIPQGPQKLSDYSESFLFYYYSWDFAEILKICRNSREGGFFCSF
jgi:hypothetical protein